MSLATFWKCSAARFPKDANRRLLGRLANQLTKIAAETQKHCLDGALWFYRTGRQQDRAGGLPKRLALASALPAASSGGGLGAGGRALRLDATISAPL
jgi:hypothetical protein